jgi:F0F1-type ATP synthase assembly protein I
LAEIDRQKEEISYLKLILSILIAIGISIIGWIFNHIEDVKDYRMIIAFFVLIVIGVLVIVLNRKIINKIDKLKDL